MRKEIDMKILCYVYENMADFEITLLLHRLKNAGKRELLFVSEDIVPIKAQSGLTYLPDAKISDVTDISEVEALLLPGGSINNEQNEIYLLIQEIVKMKKLVGAICFAPQFLGRAGVLEEYKFTTSCTKKKIKEIGIADPFNWNNYVHQRVVRDRNIITAQGFAFVDFAIEVCKYLNIYDDEEQLKQQLLRVKTNEM